MIRIENLRKTYRDGFFRRKTVNALRGATFDVSPGEIFGLLGPNGAGKTTLIKILLGIVRKTDGSAMVLDRPVGDIRVRRDVGYLPENHRLPQHLTGYTALEYYGGLSGLAPSEVRRRRDALLETVGLSDWGTTPVRKYSKGMLQRLGLAQAMLHNPKLIVLDEPTDGVDPVGRAEIRSVLQQIRDEGKTVFLNSHLLQEIELVCDRVAILDRGVVRRVARVDELTASAGAETEITLRVEGDENAIRGSLGDRVVTQWKQAGANRFEIVLPVENQQQVNEVIDKLRSIDAGIYSMTRRKSSLEDVFINIVRSAETESPGTDGHPADGGTGSRP